MQDSAQEKLIKIQKNIKEAQDYFEDNNRDFHSFKSFIFNTTISEKQQNLADNLLRPALEFNVCEPYLSRLRGEFAANEPSISVNQFSDQPVDPQIEQICEGYLRHVLDASNRDNLQYDIFTDTISGGFSAFKVITEYENEFDFNQRVLLKKVVDPTLCGWDPLAIDSHKGDGEYCYEMFPLSKESFIEQFGEEAIEGINFQSNSASNSGSWSYQTTVGKKIAIVCHYYEKKKQKKKIVQVFFSDEALKASGASSKMVSMTESDYNKLVKTWDIEFPLLPPPKVVQKRTTTFCTIVRYTVCENKILEEINTDYKYLPVIFVDGNSQRIKRTRSSGLSQKTRPFFYNAKGMQQLMNFAGSCLANELENTPQSKMMISLQSIPKQAEYQQVYMNPQIASTYVYNEVGEDGITRLTPPQIVQRAPIPAEISSTFFNGNQIIQTLLGSYDAQLGIQKSNLSGVAIENGAMNANTASTPYNVSWIKALNRALEIALDLMTKYMTAPMNLPAKGINGDSSNIQVNYPGTPSMAFNASLMKINVTAGVNFEVQRQKSLDILVNLMKVSPVLQEFISTTEHGVEMILDNVDIRGIDSLKQEIPPFIQKKQKQMAQQQQMASQNNPVAIKQMEIQQKAQSDQMSAQVKAQEVIIKKQLADTDRILAINAIQESKQNIMLQNEKVRAQNTRSAVDLAVSHAAKAHSHAMDVLNLHHENERAMQGVKNKVDGQ